MSLLALDLGTKTGWAFYRDGNVASGTETQRQNSARFEGGGMRYLRFRRWLAGFGLGPNDEVAFEEVRRHLSTDAAHVYGGFLATLTAYCEENGIPYRGVPVGTIKKHATGKGNASKEEMIVAAKQNGFDPVDDNEADALALLSYMRHEVA